MLPATSYARGLCCSFLSFLTQGPRLRIRCHRCYCGLATVSVDDGTFITVTFLGCICGPFHALCDSSCDWCSVLGGNRNGCYVSFKKENMTTPTTRRRFRFSLETLLIVVLGVGCWVAVMRPAFRRSPSPETILRGTTVHVGKSIIMATGPAVDGVEGLFVLDSLTGELSCFVLDKASSRLVPCATTNILKVFESKRKARSDFGMVVAVVEGKSFMYVFDGNTGHDALYALPRKGKEMRLIGRSREGLPLKDPHQQIKTP